MFGVVTKGDPMMMVMEFLEKGDLRKFLQNHGGDMTEDQLISICENVNSLSLLCEANPTIS